MAIKQNPNTNIYDCETNGVACLYGVINKGQTLLGSLVYGDLQGNCPNMMIPLKFEHQLLEFKNKKIYLYTDDACTYQFYEHRGFDRAGEKDIILHIGKKRVNLKCFLYSKIIV